MNKSVSVCFISDTHNQHDLVCEPAEVLIHCGDLTGWGSLRELADGFEWLDRQPHPHVAFLPGNHDMGMEADDATYLLNKLAPRVQVLQAGMNVVGPLLVAAMPYMRLEGWGFYRQDGYIHTRVEQDLLLANPDCHVLVTHDAPHGTLDVVCNRHTLFKPESVGSPIYRGLARRLGAQVHAFGHLHEQGGKRHDDEGVIYVNAAMLERDYKTKQHHGMLERISI